MADPVGEKPQLCLRHTQHSVQRHLKKLFVLIFWSIWARTVFLQPARTQQQQRPAVPGSIFLWLRENWSHGNFLGGLIAPFCVLQRICSTFWVKAVKPDFSTGWTTAAPGELGWFWGSQLKGDLISHPLTLLTCLLPCSHIVQRGKVQIGSPSAYVWHP